VWSIDNGTCPRAIGLRKLHQTKTEWEATPETASWLPNFRTKPAVISLVVQDILRCCVDLLLQSRVAETICQRYQAIEPVWESSNPVRQSELLLFVDQSYAPFVQA